MSTFNDSETADVSSSENHANPSADPKRTGPQASWPDDGSNEDGTPPLEMNRCPECGAGRFVSKLLVYEVTSYDESGEREFRRQHVRAEFEFACSECQTTLRTLPADRRDYYDEVDVLEAERQAALRNQFRRLCGRVGRWLWVTKSWITLLITASVIALLWLSSATPTNGDSPRRQERDGIRSSSSTS
ncbi:hypothetical protein C474_13204 [Halogeometricum pallidum JCM 14848]|uniref:Uncharacterized protein n=1 Tax=Halogeometricum pallidum JCM 14848 TaxID=1227487 RepID=M0D439_HALPD|nr:hypothetical protein C474_13204 [Halogeometricum pallidum JCM 14848]